jgi:hypothetical protein
MYFFSSKKCSPDRGESYGTKGVDSCNDSGRQELEFNNTDLKCSIIEISEDEIKRRCSGRLSKASSPEIAPPHTVDRKDGWKRKARKSAVADSPKVTESGDRRYYTAIFVSGSLGMQVTDEKDGSER